MAEPNDTEQQIFQAAQNVFHREGYAGARMQAIADEAGINKSMLHYYFRSKDRLFQAVFQESVKNFFPQLLEVLNAEIEFEEKIERLVETYHRIFHKHPHLPKFVIYEMNQHPDRFKKFMRSRIGKMPVRFVRQIESEIDSGRIRPVHPQVFLINAVALCVFPFVAQHMIEVIFDMDQQQFEQFLEQRKKDLARDILNTVKRGN